MVDVIAYLKDHKTRAVTIRELSEHFGVNRMNISRKVRKLAEFGILELRIDGTPDQHYRNGKKFKIYWRNKNGRTEIRPTRIE